MTEQIKKIEDKVKALIDDGKVKMKPRWFFIMQSILKILFIVLSFLIIVYFISFVIFLLKESLTLGRHPALLGWGRFLIGLPWLIILFGFIMLGLLEFLVRKYSFVYKRPIAYSLFFSIFIILILSLIVLKIDKKNRIPKFGEEGNVPVFTPMHKYYRKELKDFREKDDFRKFNDSKRIERIKDRRSFEIFE